ncbi:MAG: amino acid permease [Acidimicrobiales bacterium]
MVRALPHHEHAVGGSLFKRVLVGRPLATSAAHEQRLRKLVALPIFSADAIASSAFATEEILHVLVPVVGMLALGYLVPISVVVVVLLVVVVSSYRQTIFAYPSGGGSYVVSRDNLGTNASLVAGASLLVDYVLTVAVSIAAGTAAILSAVEPLRPYRVEVAVGLTALLALANLRGVRESGRVYSQALRGPGPRLGAAPGQHRCRHPPHGRRARRAAAPRRARGPGLCQVAPTAAPARGDRRHRRGADRQGACRLGRP